jgi:alpha-galactosidase
MPMEMSSHLPLSPGIAIHPSGLRWALVTELSTYAFGATAEGLLINLHWGGRLASLDDLPDATLGPAHSSQDPALSAIAEEYPAYGGLRYGELAARVVFADGVRDLNLLYERYELDQPDQGDQDIERLPHLIIHLRDQHYPLRVALHYQVDCANDLIIRSATLVNEGVEPITLERAFSGAWHIPPSDDPRTLVTLAGQWAEETQIQRRSLVAGTVLTESRRGITSTNAMPWLAIEVGPSTTRPAAEVYFCTLAWSGNWMLRTTSDVTGHVTLVGGISEHDFAWKLAGGSSFATPDYVAGLAQDGLNGARRRLHQYVRSWVLPSALAKQPRPVLYNSWEATAFAVHEAGQRQLAEQAARLGVELFVVDDGWFVGRMDDTAGLGDWHVDPQKFPQGLEALIERVHALGMKFGLWVEPEMVNPNSELYRAHPDWVYAFPTRTRSESRHQLVLNLGRDDVRTYVLQALDTLLQRYVIDFLKWDMNRPLSEVGWSTNDAPGHELGVEARELWVRHTLSVYAILDTLRQRYPTLSVESCASGGGRADLGILRRTDQIWTSDNTHPIARLFIQEGFSLALPARVMAAWVTDTARGQIPLAFRFHVAMLGALGIGGNLLTWNDEELAEAAYWIARYKELRPLVQEGEQVWLHSPTETRGEVAAIQYNSPTRDQALLFYFRRRQGFWGAPPRVRLRHLEEATLYRVEPILAQTQDLLSGEIPEQFQTPYSGAALMQRGILPLGDPTALYTSCLFRITKATP